MDLFAYGMVNYGMTYRLLLDILENTELYKPLCFKNDANIKRDPGYWTDTWRSTVLRNLDKEDQDIWVNLHYNSTKQRAILMRSREGIARVPQRPRKRNLE